MVEHLDPNTSSSKALSSQKASQERLSSKGSRSPPSVFERLGSGSKNSSEKKRSSLEATSSKRRRLSHSGDRDPKKPRLEMQEASVFQRLGNKSGGSGEKEPESHVHSAQVAALHTRHTVRRIVLGSGKILEEGLMDNSNPSKSI